VPVRLDLALNHGEHERIVSQCPKAVNFYWRNHHRDVARAQYTILDYFQFGVPRTGAIVDPFVDCVLQLTTVDDQRFAGAMVMGGKLRVISSCPS
jgi:hypothetical protein